MNTHQIKKELLSIELPIYFSDKRQLNLYKGDNYVAGYDPVYKIEIDASVARSIKLFL